MAQKNLQSRDLQPTPCNPIADRCSLSQSALSLFNSASRVHCVHDPRRFTLLQSAFGFLPFPSSFSSALFWYLLSFFLSLCRDYAQIYSIPKHACCRTKHRGNAVAVLYCHQWFFIIKYHIYSYYIIYLVNVAKKQACHFWISKCAADFELAVLLHTRR